MAKNQASRVLSTRAIDVMKPESILVDSGENTGLRVKCGKTGVKTFIYRYKSPITLKLVQVKIGNYPETSLAEARLRLQALKGLRRQGRCPRTESIREKEEHDRKRKELRKRQEERSFTVEKMIEFYLSEKIEDRKGSNGEVVPGSRKPKGQAEARRTLYRDVVSQIGDVPASSVSRKSVVDLVMNIVNRGANVQAGYVLRELRAAYEYAIAMGKLDNSNYNPAALAAMSLRQAKVRLSPKKGKRVLNDDELSRLLEWLPQSSYTPTQKNVLRLTLWTGCRTGEICGSSWDDFDLSRGILHIRESKTGISRNVQLPNQAQRFLEVLRLTTGKYPFPSQKTGKPIQQKQLTEQAWRMRRNRTMIDLPRWTPHDLRRSVRTGLARLGCPSEVAEAILGHTQLGVVGIYDLYSYDKESREWLQKWADHLDGLLAG